MPGSTRVLSSHALLFTLLATAAVASLPADPAPAGAYLGQRTPGTTPEVFAPGIVSDAGYRLHGSPAFHPDGNRVCWAVVPPAIMTSTRTAGGWTAPEELPLHGRGAQSPAFSADGSTFLYHAAAPDGLGSLDLWAVDLAGDRWNPARNLGPPVNSEGMESQPSLAGDGTLYFTGAMSGVGFDRGIYRCRPGPDGYGAPEALGDRINSPEIDYCPAIAPDGSFLLFASGRGRAGETLYLHLAIPTEDGGWTVPVCIHEAISFPDPARFPQLSPDGRYLFFLAGGRVYWVDASVLRPLLGTGERTSPAPGGSCP